MYYLALLILLSSTAAHAGMCYEDNNGMLICPRHDDRVIIIQQKHRGSLLNYLNRGERRGESSSDSVMDWIEDQ